MAKPCVRLYVRRTLNQSSGSKSRPMCRPRRNPSIPILGITGASQKDSRSHGKPSWPTLRQPVFPLGQPLPPGTLERGAVEPRSQKKLEPWPRFRVGVGTRVGKGGGAHLRSTPLTSELTRTSRVKLSRVNLVPS
ncbi:hypothetical protein ASPCAL12031 [Aspergillus calidoustus]|uniref:Uncharacterized protein n=1 Tax=Aspergillus calidoustus TaxID=454130 RepID=A0A0U5GAT1_ASPCI|nr:hypothetical protein ASPCAL12031 [Aspergillus calidoustus]